MGRKRVSTKVKKEEADEEIREYAATAMSELLGWYGYEKVDSGYTRGLNLDHFAPVATSKHPLPQMDRQFIFNGASSRSPMATNHQSAFSHSLRTKLPPSYYSNEISKSPDKVPATSSLEIKTVPSTSRLPYHNDSTSSSPDEMTDVGHRVISCSWCGRIGETWEPGRTNPLSCGMVNALGQFCSEACFAAGRRAAFKRARTCDWCRHVRNPISYVDFQDGESQLQFCSDKCLNQYKMNIFCRETETHLALHGLTAIPSSDSGKGGGLITPELWLRNCQSPRSSTEEILIVDDESISRLSPLSSQNVEVDRKESIDVAKSENLSLKIIRRNSFCTRTDVNTTSRAFIRKMENADEKMSEDGESVRETIKESLKDQEYQKYYHCANDRIHCRLPYSESNLLNLSQSGSSFVDHNKQRIMGSVMDGELHDRHQIYKSAIEQKTDIHVKDVKGLRGRESRSRENIRYSQQRKFRKSSSWIPEASSSPIRSEAAPSPGSCTDESRQRKYPSDLRMYTEMPSVHPGQSQLSAQAPSSSLLPPVTILVPYPIPIPIPVPIPIPLPTSVFAKFLTEKKETSLNNTDSDRKSSISDNLTDSVISTTDHTTSVKTSSPSTPAGPDKCHFTVVSSNSDSEHSSAISSKNIVSKNSTRSLRKKKRVNEDTESADRQPKRRSKFLTT
ncbi:hypothetical protein HZH66_011637 [Vespula vulgaris]|uniref:Sine oculis-binding protein n=3 Tax=Vespula vulgaris TaxID=7454 RepID=A0A834JD27_VESVU|nr:hypothetical protein HZH66_011637 [Vespula vulgaris]